MTEPLPTMLVSTAQFSPCETYRYELRRVWNPRKPAIAFIGLNPSTADAIANDPTVSRCIRRAVHLGYGGMAMLNIFAFRATDPDAMLAIDDPVGPGNDAAIAHCLTTFARVPLACWGADGAHRQRWREIVEVGKRAGVVRWRCLGVTQSGQPRHPLYLSYDQKVVPWKIPR